MDQIIKTRINLSPSLHQRLVVEAGMQRVSQNELLLSILEAALPQVSPAPPISGVPREQTVTSGPRLSVRS